MKNIIFILLICSSCAGPMSPFGSSNIRHQTSIPHEVNIDENQNLLSSAKVNFSPDKMNLHDKSDLKITINDPEGIADQHSIRFFYDGVDVTNEVYHFSKINIDKNSITFKVDDFRLIPGRDNEIIVAYKRVPMSPTIYNKYHYPICDWREALPISNSILFQNQTTTLKIIENISLSQNVNPNFIAGLIAQESSFNPFAVSFSKAIGLTQVTALAEEHVLKDNPKWPSYENLNNYSVPMIKALILAGEVNKENEWRLDPKYSVQGGIEYMEFIEGYWKLKRNKKIIDKYVLENKIDLTDVLLASYNSGPYRVKRNVMKLGKKWLTSKSLKEAKKYVNKVKSYCYHFSNDESIKI